MWGNTLVLYNTIYKPREQRLGTMVVTLCVINLKQGDSGSGLACNDNGDSDYYLTGVTSFVYKR